VGTARVYVPTGRRLATRPLRPVLAALRKEWVAKNGGLGQALGMPIADEKFVSLTTYRKNGEAKEAPVWIVDLGDGTVGFTTHGDSWKCKRIRNDNRVAMQPSDQRGTVTPGSTKVTGTAVLATGGPDFDPVRAKIKGKYGLMVNLIIVLNKVRGMLGKGGDSDTAVIITLDE